MTSPARAEEPAAAERTVAWEYLDGSELPIRLRVPWAPEWQRRETQTTLRLDHSRERVRVVVRLWPSSRQVSEDQCLTELRLLEPELTAHPQAAAAAPGATSRDDGEAILSRPFDPEPGFRGHLRAQVAAAPGDTDLYANVVGVAAANGRCLSFLANTVAAGSSAEQELAKRLQWIVEGMAKSLSVRTSDERVQKAPFPLH